MIWSGYEVVFLYSPRTCYVWTKNCIISHHNISQITMWETTQYKRLFLYLQYQYYQKRSSSSSVHVTYSGGMRVSTTNGCCQWEIKFNGTSCTNPARIYGVVSYVGTSVNQHHTSYGRLHLSYALGICMLHEQKYVLKRLMAIQDILLYLNSTLRRSS